MHLIIPDHAKAIYKWHHIELWNWEQTLFDNSVTIFEWLKIRDFVHILIIRDDKILIAQEEQPRIWKFFSFVSGSVDDTYTPLDAATKELKEEAGIIPHDLRSIVSFSPTNTVGGIHVFTTRDFDETGVQQLEPWEKINLLWVSFDELMIYMQRDDWRATEFVAWAAKKYFIPGKHEELRKLFFG